MLAQMQRASAWLLARGVRVCFRWIPSEWNTADDASRIVEKIASGTDLLEDVMPAQSSGPRVSRPRSVDTSLDICSAPAVDTFQEGRDSLIMLSHDQKKNDTRSDQAVPDRDMRIDHDDIVFEQDECESACSFATCLSRTDASPGRHSSDHGTKVDPATCSPDLVVTGTAADEVSEAHERSGSRSERSASSTMPEVSFGKVAPGDKPARHRERAVGTSTDSRVPSF